jgi:hypothetical protein
MGQGTLITVRCYWSMGFWCRLVRSCWQRGLRIEIFWKSLLDTGRWVSLDGGHVGVWFQEEWYPLYCRGGPVVFLSNGAGAGLFYQFLSVWALRLKGASRDLSSIPLSGAVVEAPPTERVGARSGAQAELGWVPGHDSSLARERLRFLVLVRTSSGSYSEVGWTRGQVLDSKAG